MELELKKAGFDTYEIGGELTLTQEETAENHRPGLLARTSPGSLRRKGGSFYIAGNCGTERRSSPVRSV